MPKTIIAGLAAFAISTAHAALAASAQEQDQGHRLAEILMQIDKCGSIGNLYGSIVADRDKGISEAHELKIFGDANDQEEVEIMSHRVHDIYTLPQLIALNREQMKGLVVKSCKANDMEAFKRLFP